VRLSLPRSGGWRAWGQASGRFERHLAEQESAAVTDAHIESETRRGRDYVRVTISVAVRAPDVAQALAAAWWVFRKAASDDAAGWDMAAATAEVQPEVKLVMRTGRRAGHAWPPRNSRVTLSLHCARGKAPVMAEPGERTAAAGHGRLLASDADREQVIDQLKAAFVQDRLTREEFGVRVGLAFTSRTHAELAALTADVPAGMTAAQSPRESALVHRRPSMNRAVTGTACMIVAIQVGMVAALLAGSGTAVLFMVVFTIVGTAVAIRALITAR
jgi:hypothetical protein